MGIRGCGRDVSRPYGNRSITTVGAGYIRPVRQHNHNSRQGGMSMEYIIRKSPRMKSFDYSTPTAYFITICTHEKACLFGSVEHPNAFAKIAEERIKKIPLHFSGVHINHSAVMPNHVHILLSVYASEIPMNQPCPNVSDIIGNYKASVSREIHRIHPQLQVWQRSFHDHVIRNEASWQKIWQYIEDNPAKWKEDCYYSK